MSQPPSSPNPFSDQGQSPFAPGGPTWSPPGPALEDDPALRWVLPVGQSVWSIVAGYLGLFSVLCLPAPLALLFGIIAVFHLRKNPRLSGWGRAIFGLVMGAVFSLFLCFWIIAMIAGAAAR